MLGTKQLVALLLLGTLFLKAHIETWFKEQASEMVSVDPSRSAVRGDFLKHFHFGFQTVLSDLLWIDFLQRHQHRKLQKHPLSWEYAQLDSITTLDPRFERAFEYGALLLSVLRQDKLGAQYLLEKWIRHRPNDWRVNYLYGYHLFMEAEDHKRAARVMLRAAQMYGAPYWLSALGVRLLGEAGALFPAMHVSLEWLRRTQDERVRERLIQRVRSLNYAIQKSRWEEALFAYRGTELREPSDIAELSSHLRDWRPEYSAWMDSNGSLKERAWLGESFQFRYEPKSKSIVSLLTPEVLQLEPLGIYRLSEETPRRVL